MQAGYDDLYSKDAPFLNRTPHALQRVRGPSGPHRHCGVCCDPQFRQAVLFPVFQSSKDQIVGWQPS